MQKVNLLLIVFLISLFGCLEKSEMMVHNLKCEYQTDPLGIDNLFPRFNWQLVSNMRGQKQSAYRILVSESLENLNKNIGEIWDSKKVSSDQSVQVLYKGRILETGKQYFWKVKGWDKDGNATTWSPPATWTMGLLNETDWKAKWVGAGSIKDSNLINDFAALKFRKVVTLDKKPLRAIARFCGLGFGEIYINGEKVSDDKLTPGWTDYTKKVLYMTYDVTDQIKPGENAFGVLLGNGWFNKPTPDMFRYDRAPWKSHPKFLLNITLTFNDGTVSEIISDETWKWQFSHITFNCVKGGETIDSRIIQHDWNKTGFSDNKWHSAFVVDPPNGKLMPQTIPPERIVRLIEPVQLTEPIPGIFVYDLGEHIAGWVRFKTSGTKGQKITLEFDENLKEDGTIKRITESGHMRGRYQTGELILSGKGSDIFEPRFTNHGFRYIQIKGLSSQPELGDLIGCNVHNDISSSGSFECSKEILNKVHNAFKVALQNSLHSVQTEPAREKVNWTQDAHNIMESAIFNFDYYVFANKTLDDVLNSQEQNGHVPPINPTATWGLTRSDGSPPIWSDPWWGGVILEIPWFIYNYFGDIEVLKKAYEPMKRFVDYLGITTVDSVFLDWNLGDWNEVNAAGHPTRTPVIQTSTAGYYYFTSLLSKIAGILHYNEDFKKYDLLSEVIKTKFNDRFLNYETGLYAHDSQTAQIMPLFLGLSPPEMNELILGRLMENIQQWNGHLSSGFVGYLYLLNGLSHFGFSDVAYEMAIKEDFPGWGFMLKDGLTTLREGWSVINYEGSGYNFASLGGVDSWYYKVLAGINPLEEHPGFKKIIIDPYFSDDLSWVQAHYDSQYGRIVSSWKKENDSLYLDIMVPVNTTASVYIPINNIKQIKESAQPILKSDVIKFDRMDKDKIILSIGSGSYHFSIPFSK
jgi:alpha-L-rhamnosidase